MGDTTLIFLHIPKTGGTTVRRALFKSVPKDVRIAAYPGQVVEPETVGDLPVEVRAAARLVSGHLSYGVHELFPGRCRYVTVVREPVGRVLSQFAAYTRRREDKGDAIDDLHERLQAWMSDPTRRAVQDNGMTRRILGIDDGSLPGDAFQRAVQVIERDFAAIATTPAVEALVRHVADIGGWEQPRRVPPRNVSSRKITAAELQQVDVDRITEVNRVDAALVEWVAEQSGGGVYSPGS